MHTNPIHRIVRPASLAAAILLASACETAVPTAAEPSAVRFASASAPVSSVTGYGRLDLSASGLPDETYMFSVRKDGNGNVSGQFDVLLTEPSTGFTADATCLEVSGNLAWIEGVVTRSDRADIPVGELDFLRVRDNGQGNAAQPDAVSFLFHGSFVAGRCAARVGTGAPWQLTKGNVQVR